MNRGLMIGLAMVVAQALLLWAAGPVGAIGVIALLFVYAFVMGRETAENRTERVRKAWNAPVRVIGLLVEFRRSGRRKLVMR